MDPSTSPTHYAKLLHVGCHNIIAAAGADVGGWIRGFSRVVELELNTRDAHPYPDESGISLSPFHGLSLAIKSLRVSFGVLPPSRILDSLIPPSRGPGLDQYRCFDQ